MVKRAKSKNDVGPDTESVQVDSSLNGVDSGSKAESLVGHCEDLMESKSTRYIFRLVFAAFMIAIIGLFLLRTVILHSVLPHYLADNIKLSFSYMPIGLSGFGVEGLKLQVFDEIKSDQEATAVDTKTDENITSLSDTNPQGSSDKPASAQFKEKLQLFADQPKSLLDVSVKHIHIDYPRLFTDNYILPYIRLEGLVLDYDGLSLKLDQIELRQLVIALKPWVDSSVRQGSVEALNGEPIVKDAGVKTHNATDIMEQASIPYTVKLDELLIQGISAVDKSQTFDWQEHAFSARTLFFDLGEITDGTLFTDVPERLIASIGALEFAHSKLQIQDDIIHQDSSQFTMQGFAVEQINLHSTAGKKPSTQGGGQILVADHGYLQLQLNTMRLAEIEMGLSSNIVWQGSGLAADSLEALLVAYTYEKSNKPSDDGAESFKLDQASIKALHIQKQSLKAQDKGLGDIELTLNDSQLDGVNLSAEAPIKELAQKTEQGESHSASYTDATYYSFQVDKLNIQGPKLKLHELQRSLALHFINANKIEYKHGSETSVSHVEHIEINELHYDLLASLNEAAISEHVGLNQTVDLSSQTEVEGQAKVGVSQISMEEERINLLQIPSLNIESLGFTEREGANQLQIKAVSQHGGYVNLARNSRGKLLLDTDALSTANITHRADLANASVKSRTGILAWFKRLFSSAKLASQLEGSSHEVIKNELEPSADTHADTSHAAKAAADTVDEASAVKPLFYMIDNYKLNAPMQLQIADFSASPLVTLQWQLKHLSLSAIQHDSNLASPTRLVLKSVVDEYGKLDLEGDWSLSDPSDFDLSVLAQHIELLPVSAYLEQSIAYQINSGQLNLDGIIHARASRLSGEIKTLLRKMHLQEIDKQRAKAAESRLNIPLSQALNLLQDYDGNVAVNIPMKGTLEKPDFKLSSFVNLLAYKAVKAQGYYYVASAVLPIGLFVEAASLFGQSIYKSLTKWPPISFNSGQSGLSDQAKTVLNKAANKLKQKPDYFVKLCAVAALHDGVQSVQASLSVERVVAVRDYLIAKGAKDYQLMQCRAQINDDALSLVYLGEE